MATGRAGAEITECHSPTLKCNHETPIAFERRFVRTTGGQPQVGVNGCLRADTNTGDGAPCVAIQDGRGLEKKQNGIGVNDDGSSYTIDAVGGQAVAFQQNTRDEVRLMGGDGQMAGALAAEAGMKQQNYIAQSMAVRRLTPVECERLQGLPDNFTRIPWRNKPADQCPDGPRYKALGNSMAVNCMEWIGQRIENIESIKL